MLGFFLFTRERKHLSRNFAFAFPSPKAAVVFGPEMSEDPGRSE